MRSIFQCQECEGGPCYVCAPNQTCSGSPYDLGGALAPLVCPYSPHWERCEFEAMPSYTATNSPFDPLLEWLNTDEGYVNEVLPEKMKYNLKSVKEFGFFN